MVRPWHAYTQLGAPLLYSLCCRSLRIYVMNPDSPLLTCWVGFIGELLVVVLNVDFTSTAPPGVWIRI